MRLVVRALAFACSIGAVSAAEVDLVPMNERNPNIGGLAVSVVGDIVPGDAARFSDMLNRAAKMKRPVVSALLQSPGGSLAEGIRLAALIRVAGISAIVPAGALCASACFVAFAGGGVKIIESGARVGVHGASVNGVETDAATAGTIAMAREVARLGVPPAIIGKMVVTPPDRILWLSPDDLLSMRSQIGAVYVDP